MVNLNKELPKWFEIGIEEETHTFLEYKNQWEIKERIVSYWRKEKATSYKDECTVTRTRCISNLTGEVKDFFELGGWQPFPIKGRFESTYGYIASWLIRNGYKSYREVRYIHD